MSRPVLWVIDDTPSNFHLVHRSLPEPRSAYELLHYERGEDAIEALPPLIESPEGRPFLPDIIFMDYFMGSMYGDEISRQILALFQSARLRGPWILGHSSVFKASQRIAATAGGDAIAIRKPGGAERSPDILELFPDVEALNKHAGRSGQTRGDPSSPVG